MPKFKPRERLLLWVLLAFVLILVSQNLANELNFKIKNARHILESTQEQHLHNFDAYEETLQKISAIGAKLKHSIIQLNQSNEKLNEILNQIYSTAPNPLEAISVALQTAQEHHLHTNSIGLAGKDFAAILLQGSGKFKGIAGFMADSNKLLKNFTDIDFVWLKNNGDAIEFEFLAQDLRIFQNLSVSDSEKSQKLELLDFSPACDLQCVQNLQAALNAPYSHILITHDPFSTQNSQIAQSVHLQGIFNGKALINDQLYSIGASPFFEIVQIGENYIIIKALDSQKHEKIQIGTRIQIDTL